MKKVSPSWLAPPSHKGRRLLPTQVERSYPLDNGARQLARAFPTKFIGFSLLQVSNESIDLLLLKKLGSIEEGSVFDEMIQLLKHMKNDMMTNIVSYVVDDTKARSKPYRRDK